MRLLLPIAAILLATACSDGTAPRSSITGTFVLRTVDRQPLPVLLTQERLMYPAGSGMGTRRENLNAMRLVLGPGSADSLHVERAVWWTLDSGNDPAPEVSEVTSAIEVRGDTLCLRVGNFHDMDDPCRNGLVLQRRGERLYVQMPPAPYPGTGRAEYEFQPVQP